MDRPISPNEVKVLNWLLDHALVDVTPYRLHAVEGLRVVGGCSCGCASLYFEPEGQRGFQMLADELAVYPDGQQAGLILWGRKARSSGWKCTISIRGRPTAFRMSPSYALGMSWDVERPRTGQAIPVNPLRLISARVRGLVTIDTSPLHSSSG
jgi:hypothetical protein